MARKLWFGLAGMAVGGAVAVGLAVTAAYAFGISQAEGAYAMQVVFFYLPFGAILGLMAGLVLARRKD